MFFAANSAGSPLYFPVTPGDVITYGGWASRVAGDGLARYSIAVRDANKANPSYRTTTPSNVTTASWTFQQGTYTVPLGKAFLLFYPEVFNNTVTAEARFDDAILKKGGGGFTYVATTGVSTTVSPRTTSLTLTQTQQFTANVTGTTNPAVNWAVDGIAGGNSAVGTISSSGFYTPPPNAGQHTITATSVADSTKNASATVFITSYAGMFTYHNSNDRAGANREEFALSPSNVNQNQFGKLFPFAVDGYVYAQPLYVANVNIPGKGTHNVIYIVTAHDSVYAVDADTKSSTPLWQTRLLGTGATPIPASDFPGTAVPTLFGPEIGITSTPVIDPIAQTLYVVAATRENNTHVQSLHALDITTGAPKIPRKIIQGSVKGTGAGSDGFGNLPFDPHQHLQRSGLALANVKVYVAFAAHYDHQPYHGWVFAYDATTLNKQAIYCVTRNGQGYGAGIWMSGAAPGVDGSGNLYVTTGNGDFTANIGGTEYGETVLKLSANLSVVDWFAPANQSYLNTTDYDLGSGGTLLLPDQTGTSHTHELVTYGKDPVGTIYVLDRDNLGHYKSSGNAQIVQSISRQIGDGASKIRSMAAYWNGKLYFIAMNDVLKTFSLTNGLLSSTPVAKASGAFGFPGATPSISSNGASNGIVWAIQNNSGSPAVLRAFNASNVAVELYNSNQAGTRDTPDAATSFALPTIANGKVYIAGRKTLTVYGLLP